MQAIIITSRPQKGDLPNEVKLITKIKPVPCKNEVLIKISCATITIDDINMQEGSALGGIPIGPTASIEKPVIPGIELSGIVEDIGSDISKFKVGDAVFGSIGLPIKREGPWAEYCCIKEEFLFQKPNYLSFQEAAALAGSGIVACSAIVQGCKLQKNQKILIIGASGGVGTLAIQMAKNCGAYVIATCSEKNKSLVKSLGAEKVFDYASTSLEEDLIKENCDNLDFVLDLVGGKEIEKLGIRLLKKSGKFITSVGPIKYLGDNKLGGIGILKLLSYIGWRMFSSSFKGPKYDFVSPTKKTYPFFKQILETNSIKPIIDKEINFTQKEIEEAINYVRTHRATGKVVILINRL